MEDKPFRSLLGALLYLSTRTRPDLATAVSMLGKYQSDPGPAQWKLLKQLLRYLRGTTKHGLNLPKASNKVKLDAWSDADWARDKGNRRSRSGYVLYVNSGPIIWSSKLHTSTALSTAESEFVALSSCVREVRWIRSLLSEIGCLETGPTTIYQDNLGAISWTEHVQGLMKVKHVGIKYHYVREAVVRKDVEVAYAPSSVNRADSLTKGLVGETFENHRQWLSVKVQDIDQ